METATDKKQSQFRVKLLVCSGAFEHGDTEGERFKGQLQEGGSMWDWCIKQDLRLNN